MRILDFSCKERYKYVQLFIFFQLNKLYTQNSIFIFGLSKYISQNILNIII